MTNPILKRGDVVASGVSNFDGKRHQYYLTYSGFHENRCIVPRQVLADFERLGIAVEEHWNRRIVQEGHSSSHYIDYHDGQVPVSPHIRQLLTGDLKNHEFKHILEEEY